MGRAAAPLRPLLLLTLLVAAGCAARPDRPTPALVPIAPGEGPLLVAQWEAAWRAFPGLRGAVELVVRAGERVDRNAALLLLAPQGVRLEVTTPLGLPGLVATANPERVTIFRPFERRAVGGPTTPRTLARWLGVPLPLDAFTRLLAGYAPAPDDPGAARVETDGGDHVRYEAGGLPCRVWITRSGLPARLTLEGPEPIVATLLRTVTGEVQDLLVEAPRRGAELSLRYLQAELVAPPAQAFELTLPPDVPVVSAD